MPSAVRASPGRKADPALVARRREEILDAAARLFAERGFSETDTQVLSDELGVGKGTLYRYFPSKRDLFLAAADRVMRRLRAHIDDRLTGIEDPFQRITTAIRAFLEYCSNHPEFVELLVQERAQFRDRKKPTYFEHREAHVKRWQDLYRTLIGAGRIRDIPVERISTIVSMLLYGCLFTNYFHAFERRPESHTDDILDILLNGILSDRERKHRTGRNRSER
jgi:AcrR family transcriptional regulator